VGVAEHPPVGVLGQERQHPLLAAAALGYVVLLHHGVLAVEGDGVEVEVKAHASLEAERAHGVEPGAHQLGVAGRADAAGVLGQERPLGDHVEPGEQGQALVEHRRHGVVRTPV